MKTALKRTTLNRYKSLIHTFGDRQFTALDAADRLGVMETKHVAYDLMRALHQNNLVIKIGSTGRNAMFRIVECIPPVARAGHAEQLPLPTPTPQDYSVAELAAMLGVEHAQPVVDEVAPVTQKAWVGLSADRLVPTPHEHKKEAPAPPAASSLPTTLMIDGIKYVRLDRIAEVIIDHL